MPNSKICLDAIQAATFLKLRRRTLDRMRMCGGGPNYLKHGRTVRYRIRDLEAWSAQRGE